MTEPHHDSPGAASNPLPIDAQLSRLYRQHAKAEPPAAVDQHILAAARAALDLAQTTEALHTDRAWRWLAPAIALSTPGASPAEQARAADWAQAGQQWLRAAAGAQMAPEFADSFLHQHPVNQALLAWHPVTPDAGHVTGP